jgi:hypothetical protein
LCIGSDSRQQRKKADKYCDFFHVECTD